MAAWWLVCDSLNGFDVADSDYSANDFETVLHFFRGKRYGLVAGVVAHDYKIPT